MSARVRTSPRRLIVLGSTGSIGVAALEVVKFLNTGAHGRFNIVGLAAGQNGELLTRQARAFGVQHVAIADPNAADSLSSLSTVEVIQGPDAALKLVEAVARKGDLVLGAMVGAAGVPATIAAIQRGCDIALANKETLVAAGHIVMPMVQEHGVNLLPVDSEHSAVAQCLRAGRNVEEVKRLVLTASGGPFRTWERDRLEHATAEEALHHPTWAMGKKITIDSASLMNKALEVIEAHWLFGLPAERIDVIVHPQSIVHSFVEFVDGSVIAQLGPPDMRTPIQYALTWPERAPGASDTMNWAELSKLDFEPVDHDRFPSVKLAYEVIWAGGTSGAIFNAANEAAVGAFLEGRIPFGEITRLVGATLAALPPQPISQLSDVLHADLAARKFVLQYLGVTGPESIATRTSPPRSTVR